MNLITTLPTEAHIEALCRDLRDADRRELEALDRGAPAQIIREALATSQDCTAVLDGDNLLCLFGVNEQQEAFGLPWMLTTEHAQQRHMRRLLPLAKHVLGQWLGHRPTLCNLVHASNTRAIRRT